MAKELEKRYQLMMLQVGNESDKYELERERQEKTNLDFISNPLERE